MSKNRWIYVTAMLVHSFCVISFIEKGEIDYGTPFLGATYWGDVKNYGNVILMFSVYFLYSFGDTKRYVSGYGTLQMMRSLKRGVVVQHIILNKIKNVIVLTSMLYTSFIVECFMIGQKILEVKLGDIFIDMILHVLVMYSLLLWQSILEVIFDERIAIGAVLCMVIIQIAIGNMVYTYGLSEGMNLVFYVNLYASVRTDYMSISKSLMLGVIFIMLIMQVLFLKRVIVKKDIFQMSS